jgi:hypothetical protein
MSILITEKKMRQIVREMLQEADSSFMTPTAIKQYDYSPVYDPYATDDEINLKQRGPAAAEARERLRKRAVGVKDLLKFVLDFEKVVTSANSTAQDNRDMSAYLIWYSNSRGVSLEKPWIELGVGNVGGQWPAAALYKFQVEQGLYADGKLGPQTATYIMTGGKTRIAVRGMKLSQSDVAAKLERGMEELFTDLNIGEMSPEKSSITDPNAPNPMETRRTYSAKDQASLVRRKVPAMPAKKTVSSAVKSSYQIDALKEEVMNVFDDGTDLTVSSKLDMYAPREIANFRDTVQTIVDNAESYASSTSGRSARNTVSLALNKGGVPIVMFAQKVPGLLDTLEQLFIAINPSSGFTPA